MSAEANIQLCPAQKRAFDAISLGLPLGSVFYFTGKTGRGKTTVLRHLHQKTGGAFLSLKEFVERSEGSHPMAVEETLHRLILNALKSNEIVYVDDVHMIDIGSGGC